MIWQMSARLNRGAFVDLVGYPVLRGDIYCPTTAG
jgi:hypothetical protein